MDTDFLRNILGKNDSEDMSVPNASSDFIKSLFNGTGISPDTTNIPSPISDESSANFLQNLLKKNTVLDQPIVNKPMVIQKIQEVAAPQAEEEDTNKPTNVPSKAADVEEPVLQEKSSQPRETSKVDEDLLAKYRDSRDKADDIARRMGMLESIGNAGGLHQDTTSLQLMYKNALGAAEDYKDAIIEKRVQDKHGIELQKLRAEANNADAKSNPDSDVSEFSRSIIKKMAAGTGMKIDIGDNASAAQLEQMFGPVERYMSFVEGKMLQTERMNMAKKDKEEKHDYDRFDKVNKTLNQELASSRSTFGRNAGIVRSASALEQLVSGKNLNDVNPQQFYEIAKSLDSMLSQTAGTVSGTEKLMPRTALKDVASFKQYLGGKPAGMQMADFVKSYLDTVGREKDLAFKNIGKTKKQILGSYLDLREKYPAKWSEVMRANDLPEDVFDDKSEKSTQEINVDQNALSAEMKRRGL